MASGRGRGGNRTPVLPRFRMRDYLEAEPVRARVAEIVPHVGASGLEPLASTVSRWRSAPELSTLVFFVPRKFNVLEAVVCDLLP